MPLVMTARSNLKKTQKSQPGEVGRAFPVHRMFKKALSTLNARPLHRTEMHSPSPSSAALRAPPSALSIYVLYFIALTVRSAWAIAEAHLAAVYNRAQTIVHHYTYCSLAGSASNSNEEAAGDAATQTRPYLRKRRVFGCTKWSAIRNTNVPISVTHHSGQSDAQRINSECRTGWK